MLLLILTIDQDVIKEAYDTGKAFKDLVHPSLEVLCGARYPKWHLVEAVAAIGSDEGGQ